MAKATFAGGCFWCMVKPFHKYEGVEHVISGYTGDMSIIRRISKSVLRRRVI